MELLYKNREQSEKDFITLVCNDILSKPIEEKEYSEDFAFIFVDGRKDTNFETLEHWAAFHSCHAFSQKRYPIFCFVNNIEGLKSLELINKYNLTLIEIPEINSLEEYSNFCIKELYFKLPENIKKVITIQADGFLLKDGWEKYILDNNFDWISSHWKHFAGIDLYDEKNNKWNQIINKTAIGNGGFSFRKAYHMRDLSKVFGKVLDRMRECGREDNRFPMEDLFFAGLGFTVHPFKQITLKQCDEFSKDPLTLKDWNNKTYGFGFHYFKTVSEFPECNHE